MREMIKKSDNLKIITSQIQTLPTLPKVVNRVIELVADPETSSACLARAISTDAAMVSRVLKAANSAYYGLPQKVSTITQATVVLGFNTIKNLVLTTSVFSTFKGSGVSRFNREEFWLHSIGCATISKIICRQIHIGMPEEAFIAGLLHDIGKIVEDQFLYENIEKILTCIDETHVSFKEAEQIIQGIDHTEIGFLLCDKWNFPLHLQEAVAFHHNPGKATIDKELVSLVHLANSIAIEESLGYGGDPFTPVIDPIVEKILGITQPEIDELKEEIFEEYEKAVGFLELMVSN